MYIYIYIFHSIDERYLENFIPINKPKQVKKKKVFKHSKTNISHEMRFEQWYFLQEQNTQYP